MHIQVYINYCFLFRHSDPPSDNPLQIAILNLFITLKSRFPNLVVGAITRESVKKALANGITADQARSHVSLTIISYCSFMTPIDHKLSDYARPPTNAEKCKLWAIEPT